ncbi:MAG: hypothetical protein Q8M94_14330 [Ignavibacteria bacterium]|nr:hypothetical protein [Ignavibacteria bacterium]
MSNKFKIYGWIILFFGILLGVTRFYFGIKLELFNFKVFAIYSKYFETNYFKVIENHFSEEAAALLLLIGLFLISFTKEKIENDTVAALRYKSLILTFYINTSLVVLSFLFVYGFGFINILVINIFSPLILYILLFKFYLHKSLKPEKTKTDTANC